MDSRTIQEMEQVEKAIQSHILEWSVQMNGIREAFDSYVSCMKTKVKSDTAASVENYMEDVHKYLIGQFYSLFVEMESRIILYVEGFPMESETVDSLSEERTEYDKEHLSEDFCMMEKMMDELETLIKKCSEINTAEIECYQKGGIWKYGETWELELLAKERAACSKKNREALQKALRAYKERLAGR